MKRDLNNTQATQIHALLFAGLRLARGKALETYGETMKETDAEKIREIDVATKVLEQVWPLTNWIAETREVFEDGEV